MKVEEYKGYSVQLEGGTFRAHEIVREGVIGEEVASDDTLKGVKAALDKLAASTVKGMKVIVSQDSYGHEGEPYVHGVITSYREHENYSGTRTREYRVQVGKSWLYKRARELFAVTPENLARVSAITENEKQVMTIRQANEHLCEKLVQLSPAELGEEMSA
jgi:hypothetical protein